MFGEGRLQPLCASWLVCSMFLFCCHYFKFGDSWARSWQPCTRSYTLAVVNCMCVYWLFETLLPAVEYHMSMGCVGTARAKITTNRCHERKTGLLSVPLCACVCVPHHLFIVLLFVGRAKCHDRGDQVHVPQEPWVPSLHSRLKPHKSHWRSSQSSTCSHRHWPYVLRCVVKYVCVCFRSSVVPSQTVYSPWPK